MAAGKDQVTPWRSGDAYAYGVKGGTRIYAGTLVALTASGFAVPAGHTDAKVIVGVSAHHADNRDGFDDDGHIRVQKDRTWRLAFDAAPTVTDIGKPVYAVDDDTVSLSDGSGSRLQVGTLDGIENGIGWTKV